MDYNLNNVSIISSVITSYYQKLVNLILEGKEDNDEYNDILDKIKHIVKVEKKAYSNISLETINEYYKNTDFDGDNPIENRTFSRLSEREKVLNDKQRLDDDSLLSSVLDAKITIDMIKLVYQKLINLKEENIDEDTYFSLMMYYHVSKFTYLTDSSFIEKIALEHNFNVEEIPTISFEEINKAFGIDLHNDLMEILYLNIYEELSALYELSEKDPILNTYSALTELSRIEVMLSYLDEKTLDRLINSYNQEYGDSKKETMINANNLIKKRKKEFKK